MRVLWRDLAGNGHEEEAQTTVISRHGVLVYLSRPLPLETPLRLTNRTTNHNADALVAWTGDTLPDGSTRVGVGFLSPVRPEFWGVMGVRLWDEEEQAAPANGWFQRLWAWLRGTLS